MKLGEMLVRDGRLTEPQLGSALGFQARDGARLGTVLVEHGMVDLEALTVYLGLELGIPIATGAMLERAKRAAVRLLQPAQAFKHKCIPLVVQDRQLIAAIEDPHDFATLEALNSITGYRVLPRVTPEVRIYYYIERYYGRPRPIATASSRCCSARRPRCSTPPSCSPCATTSRSAGARSASCRATRTSSTC